MNFFILKYYLDRDIFKYFKINLFFLITKKRF